MSLISFGVKGKLFNRRKPFMKASPQLALSSAKSNWKLHGHSCLKPDLARSSLASMKKDATASDNTSGALRKSSVGKLSAAQVWGVGSAPTTCGNAERAWWPACNSSQSSYGRHRESRTSRQAWLAVSLTLGSTERPYLNQQGEK